jgi:protein-S-isoprenylcysteine O-methyltransferase Ste14
MGDHPAATRQPGERLMIAGAIVTVIGMVLTFVAIVPLANSKWNLPSIFWALAMVTGIGLGLLMYGFWRAARGRSKRIRRAAAEFDQQQGSGANR